MEVKFNHFGTLAFDISTGSSPPANGYTTDPFLIAITDPSSTLLPDPEYYANDHLGNAHLVYKMNYNCASSPTLQNKTLQYAADYYAFGKVAREYINGLISEKFKFTGKERDVETGLDYFGARYYSSELGRFTGVDPLVAKYASWNGYNYTLNNPIKMIDPDGLEPDDWYRNNKTGDYVWFEGCNTIRGYTRIGENRFSSVNNNIFYWKGEDEVVAFGSESSTKFRLIAIEGGRTETDMGLHIINASMQNRLVNNFEGADDFGDLLSGKQYNGVRHPDYKNFDNHLDNIYRDAGSKGNEFLENVAKVMYSNSVQVLKNQYGMKEAKYILGYSHNNETLFGKYKHLIPFDKKKTKITNVESSINIFDDFKD